MGHLTMQRLLARQARQATLDAEIDGAFETILMPEESPRTVPMTPWDMPTQRIGIIWAS